MLLALRKTNGQLKKEFEFFQEITSKSALPLTAVKSMRDLWQKHSNAHRPDLVVSEVYGKDAFYLNRGNLLNDRDDIIKEYSYMTNTSWGISLVEEGSLRVSNECISEIGTYAEGKGQYLLIWKLDSKGNWRIRLDFNF